MAWQPLKVVDKIQAVCYYCVNKISPYKPQEIVSSMYYCRNKALLEKHLSYGMLFRSYLLRYWEGESSSFYAASHGIAP